MDKKSVQPLEELLDSVRDIDGFPIANDEDILALSDPPFYTACPNPFIQEFINEYGKFFDETDDDYDIKPFVGKVSEGKGDSLYKAHPYHTKVPHKAIMQYIAHYTEPGDIVFDGFCGSGMTGVAAQMLGRHVILSDLSPIATFISQNYNHPVDYNQYELEAIKILNDVNEECRWMFKTKHTNKAVDTKTGDNVELLDSNLNIEGNINFIVWSDVFNCPYCKNEYVFFEEAFDLNQKKVNKEYQCSNCNSKITKRQSERAFDEIYDSVLQKDVKFLKEKPVLINYQVDGNTYEKIPDNDDLELINKIDANEIPYWFPINRMRNGEESRRNDKYGIEYVHQFYSKRQLTVLSKVFNILMNSDSPIKNYLLFTFQQAVIGMAKICRYVPTHFSQVNQYLSGTLYVGSLRVETSLDYLINNKIKRLIKVLKSTEEFNESNSIITTQSIVNLKQIPDNSIDYIFTDPPFGSNLMYSELSYFWETWLKVITANETEAIVNKIQNKDLNGYKHLMTEGFKEMYRILKPNHWITIVFHNSKASVWNAIQEGINRAGFIIGQVSVLDKKQRSFQQITTSGSVKNDLVINAYKPKSDFATRFLINAGEDMEFDFIKQQLEHLKVRPTIERTEKMLYSKMLAHYVENGFKIRYNSSNFYKLLADQFTELDGYWFTDEQIKEYNEWKSGLSLDKLKEKLDGQQILLVTDEKSSLTWIYNFLNEKKDFNDILTAYRQVTTKSDDQIPELRDILDNNFIIEKGKYRRPLDKKERDEIDKNREKELEQAFNNLLNEARTKKGKIKEVRREALVHGFTKCYQEGKYQDILTIADKLYASTLESSGDIMDFVDIARIKTSGQKKL